MNSPDKTPVTVTADPRLFQSVDSTDIVSAYNDNPLISKEIAARLDELRHDGDRPTRYQLLQIIADETSKSPAIKKQREAEELAKRHQHPLYNTLYREDLLRFWNTHGTPPAMPEAALDGFTDWIMRHAGASEDDVRELAATLEKDSEATTRHKLGLIGDKFFDDHRPTPRTEKNLRRTLRTAFRQCNEQTAHILHVVKKGSGQEYVSDITRNSRKWQLRAQDKWIRATTVSTTKTDQKTGKDVDFSMPLAECIRTPEHRRNELYTLVKGQESYFTSQGRVALFVTITTPARFHFAPSHGITSWDGSSVRDSHDWLTDRWQHLRADLAKHVIKPEGFRVTEPHKDGSEHWHLMLYVKRNQLEETKNIFMSYFGHSEHAVQFKADFSKNVKEKKATAASYMLKYLIKTISSNAASDTSAANDKKFLQEADAADAWRSTWGIRGFQFFGTLFGKQTLWRELRRLDEQPSETAALALWRAARGGRAHHFIAHLIHLDPELATIHERTPDWTEPDSDTGEIQEYMKKGRIVGIEINRRFYLTHDSKWELETDYSLLNDDFDKKVAPVTVIHKNPRGDASHDNRQGKIHGFGAKLRKNDYPPPSNGKAA